MKKARRESWLRARHTSWQGGVWRSGDSSSWSIAARRMAGSEAGPQAEASHLHRTVLYRGPNFSESNITQAKSL